MKYLFLALSIASSSVAFGWGEMGHKLVGSIAEETMSDDAKAMVRGILGVEPMYVSAIWPDLVRDDARFATRGNEFNDFSPYHFCEVPAGQTYSTNPRKIERDCFSAVEFSKKLIIDPKNSRETKMIALRYIIHVVGDIHQPLHVGNGFDRGANACQIDWKRDPTTPSRPNRKNFHSFWDETMVDQFNDKLGGGFFGASFKTLKKIHPEIFGAEGATPEDRRIAMDKAKAPYVGQKPLEWIDESAKLRDSLYPDSDEVKQNAKAGEEYKSRPYCNWYVDQNKDRDPAPGSVIDTSKIPLVDGTYATKFTPVVEEQILKAGLRLATVLDEIAKETAGQNRITDKDQEDIFSIVSKFLKNIF